MISARAHAGKGSRRVVAGVLAIGLGMPLAGFGPAVGAGFVRDDFLWLWHARLEGADDLLRLLTEHLGFYRPVTSLAWAFDLLRAGPDPAAFGVTNLRLHVLVLLVFAAAAARLSRPDPAGPSGGPDTEPGPVGATVLVVVFLAAGSHHYSRMAVLWISGRGALLGALPGAGAILVWDGWLRGRGGTSRGLAATALAGLAAFSYEAALGVTGILALMVFLRGRGTRRHWSVAALPLSVLALYVLVRSWFGAMQPWAPEAGYGYRAGVMLPNLLEYVGRAVVPGLLVLLLLLVLATVCGGLRRVLRACRAGAAAVLPLGAGWFLLGILPALPVPRRSDLYVYFAALGIHLVAGSAVARGFLELRAAPRTRRRARFGASVLTTVFLVAWLPWAWDRNAGWARPGRLAMAVVAELEGVAGQARDRDCWVFHDRRPLAPDLRDAFASQLPAVVGLVRRGPPEPDAWWAGEEGRAGRLERCRRVFHLALLDIGDDGTPELEVEVRSPG